MKLFSFAVAMLALVCLVSPGFANGHIGFGGGFGHNTFFRARIFTPFVPTIAVQTPFASFGYGGGYGASLNTFGAYNAFAAPSCSVQSFQQFQQHVPQQSFQQYAPQQNFGVPYMPPAPVVQTFQQQQAPVIVQQAPPVIVQQLPPPVIVQQYQSYHAASALGIVGVNPFFGLHHVHSQGVVNGVLDRVFNRVLGQRVGIRHRAFLH